MAVLRVEALAMENQHRLIAGYRDLSEAEIADVNAAKQIAEEVGRWVEQIRDRDGYDQRWVSIGATHLQQGFMAIIRGITRPTTF
jgi:hypothetical protein